MAAHAQSIDDRTVKLKGADGKPYDSSQLRGQVLLLSFGATWCQPCTAELQALEDLKREYRNAPLQIWWVSIENEGEQSNRQLISFMRNTGATTPVLRDPDGKFYSMFSSTTRLPLVVFYDREGKYTAPVQTGMATPEMYKSRVRERLKTLLPPK